MKVLYGTASRHFGALSFDLFDDATARVVFRCRQQLCQFGDGDEDER